jgi:hypothetical protein
MISFENLAYGASPLLYPPHRGEEGIKAFPLDGERLDRGESLSHMPPFSSSVGVRKIMNHFVVRISFIGNHALALSTKDKVRRSTSMKPFLMSIALTIALVFLSVAELGFVSDAEAIIGLPRTPLSFAGVARRSMYREAAVATTAAVTTAAATSAAAANAAAANAAAEQAAAANTAAAQAAAANAAAATAAAHAASSALPIGTIVPSLPPGCKSAVISGVSYSDCNGVFYRAGFQGNNIVYIVSQP